jgi:hypothetical protein
MTSRRPHDSGPLPARLGFIRLGGIFSSSGFCADGTGTREVVSFEVCHRKYSRATTGKTKLANWDAGILSCTSTSPAVELTPLTGATQDCVPKLAAFLLAQSTL